MEKYNRGSILNNRYRIEGLYKVENEYNIYKAEDTRFPGNFWLVHQILLINTSKNFINNLFVTLANLSKVVYEKIGKISDYFIDKDYLIVVTEYLNGSLLKEVIYSSNFSSSTVKAIKLGLQLLEIVKYFYEKDLIRFIDLNPENIIIERNGIIKILSFSVNKLMDLINDDGVNQNYFIGTFGYIPPEFLDDKISMINQSSFIYIICAIMYEFITKVPPYLRDDPFIFPPAITLNSLISIELSRVLEKNLAYSSHNRYRTFKEFEKKLYEILYKETTDIEPQRLPIFSLLKNKLFLGISLFFFIQLIIIIWLVIYYIMIM
jgi:serine/threonine protein kinase